MFLLIHDERNDPISNVLLRQQLRVEALLGERLVALSLAKILQDATIYDVIENGHPRLNWSFSDLEPISNTLDVKLVNRVSRVPQELFHDFHPEDREYAHIEFSAYMNFALNAFECKLGEPGFFGLCGQRYPMPLQWNLLQRAGLAVQLPRYYLGTPHFCPFDFSKDNSEFIINHTYGYRHWKPGGRPEGKNVFAVRRPGGSPYFAFVVDQEVLVMAGPQSSPISQILSERIKFISLEIAKCLKSPIAELLFFVEGESITFGVADTIPVATIHHPEFDDTLLLGIKGFFERQSYGKSS